MSASGRNRPYNIRISNTELSDAVSTALKAAGNLLGREGVSSDFNDDNRAFQKAHISTRTSPNGVSRCRSRGARVTSVPCH